MSELKKIILEKVKLSMSELDISKNDKIYLELTGGRDSNISAICLLELGYTLDLNVTIQDNYPQQMLEKTLAHRRARDLHKQYKNCTYRHAMVEDIMELSLYSSDLIDLQGESGKGYSQLVPNILRSMMCADSRYIAMGVKDEESALSYIKTFEMLNSAMSVTRTSLESPILVLPLKYISNPLLQAYIREDKESIGMFWSCFAPVDSDTGESSGLSNTSRLGPVLKPCGKCEKCLEYSYSHNATDPDGSRVMDGQYPEIYNPSYVLESEGIELCDFKLKSNGAGYSVHKLSLALKRAAIKLDRSSISDIREASDILESISIVHRDSAVEGWWNHLSLTSKLSCILNIPKCLTELMYLLDVNVKFGKGSYCEDDLKVYIRDVSVSELDEAIKVLKDDSPSNDVGKAILMNAIERIDCQDITYIGSNLVYNILGLLEIERLHEYVLSSLNETKVNKERV